MDKLQQALRDLPLLFPGPGGACAVLRDGAVLEQHAWGYANAERRIAFTPKTLFRICSITKQFTCGLVLDAFADPSVLDGDVADFLPHLEGAAPGILQLCHNQSGLRDYWAVAMLQGAPVESSFGDQEAAKLVAGTRTLQFQPGTRYSYCNQNFRLLSDMMQRRTGRSFAELLRARLFDKVGMGSAILAAETASMPDGTQGYEGSQPSGFRRAENNIFWTGDAGIAASLADMIAWEQHIDATREDSSALYQRLCADVQFANGAAAAYGFGLSRRPELGMRATGHGGALRGWRSHRMYLPEQRVSVVVMFNHLSDAHEAAVSLLAAALGVDSAPVAEHAAPSWVGSYIEPETNLLVRINPVGRGKIRLRYGHSAEVLRVQSDGSAAGDGARLYQDGGALMMQRPYENHCSALVVCEGAARLDIAGVYYCAELDATLTVAGHAGVFYGAFSGMLGRGRMELLEHAGGDVWALPCPRALDHTPPGDWTLAFAAGEVVVGCWLARGLRYLRVG